MHYNRFHRCPTAEIGTSDRRTRRRATRAGGGSRSACKVDNPSRGRSKTGCAALRLFARRRSNCRKDCPLDAASMPNAIADMLPPGHHTGRIEPGKIEIVSRSFRATSITAGRISHCRRGGCNCGAGECVAGFGRARVSPFRSAFRLGGTSVTEQRQSNRQAGQATSAPAMGLAETM